MGGLEEMGLGVDGDRGFWMGRRTVSSLLFDVQLGLRKEAAWLGLNRRGGAPFGLGEVAFLASCPHSLHHSKTVAIIFDISTVVLFPEIF